MKEERIKVGKSRTFAREIGIRAGAWRGKGGLPSEGRRFRGGEGGQSRRASSG